VAPSTLLRPVVEAVLQNILFSIVIVVVIILFKVIGIKVVIISIGNKVNKAS
jgi:hypothetical protein